MTEKNMRLSDFNDKHLGSTVYIVGCAPHVNDLSKEFLDDLEDEVVIGVNYSHAKVKNLTYMIAGHLDSVAYMLEYGPSEIPIFVHKSQETSYAKEIWDNERVVEIWDLNNTVPLPRYSNANSNLHGSISILLSATNLAYIMGATKIVYVGFEETSQLHFYNIDKSLETEITTNLQNILDEGKYWNPINYANQWVGIQNKINIHAAIEVQLNKCYNAPKYQPQFNRSLEDLSNTPFSNDGGRNERREHFSLYVNDLNSNGVETLTVAARGITIESGCLYTDTYLKENVQKSIFIKT